jgi:hypothetical protein
MENYKKEPSTRRVEANRKNSTKSTGPRTLRGKMASRWNAMKHGLLSRKLLFHDGNGKGSPEEFKYLLESLRQDRQPVGALEELLVEKIATEYWKLHIATQHETGAIREGYAFSRHPDSKPNVNAIEQFYQNDDDLEKILRYGSTINRQLFQAITQLERLQRLRKEALPTSVSMAVAGTDSFCKTKPISPSASTQLPESPAPRDEEEQPS